MTSAIMSYDGFRMSEAMGTETVTLIVGKKRKEFIVHKKLICNASKYFNDAFNGPFKEGKEGTMYMSEDDPEIVAFLVDWLYKSPLPYIRDTVKPDEKPSKKGSGIIKLGDVEFGPPTEAEHHSKLAKEKKDAAAKQKALQARLDKPFDNLFKLYYFAEKLLINPLKNQAMDRIRSSMDIFDRSMTTATCKEVYANTYKDSPLRKFSTDLIAYKLADASDEFINKVVVLQKQLPEFCRDLLLKTKSLVVVDIELQIDCGLGSHPDPRNDILPCFCGYCDEDFSEMEHDMCRYHDHEGDEKDQGHSHLTSFH